MDDDVARVDQDPVAGGLAFAARAGEAGFLQAPQDLVGHGADMALGAPGRDHHGVGDVGLAREIDRDDLLGLVVVKFLYDQG